MSVVGLQSNVDAPKPVLTVPMEGSNAQSTQTPQEAPKEAPKPTEKDVFSERAQMLIQKEKRALRAKEEAKALKAQVAAERAQIEAQSAKLKEFDSIKQTNPLKALEMLGLDYNALTQIYLNNGVPTTEVQVQKIQQEVEAYKKEQAEKERQQAEEAKKAAEAEMNEVLTQFRSEIGSFLDSKKDHYEFINLFDQQNLVYDVIQEHYNRTGRVQTIKEASDLVEKYLEEQLKRSTATKKFQQILSPGGNTSPKESQSQPKQSPPRTLSNNMTSSAATYLHAKTEQDRMQRAMAALDNQ